VAVNSVNNSAVDISSIDPRGLKDWFKDNKADLAEDIVASAHEWVKETPNGLCGYTQYNKRATVFLSGSVCPLVTEAQASEQLIVESLHHFGFNSKRVE